jgi:hypothetical protein
MQSPGSYMRDGVMSIRFRRVRASAGEPPRPTVRGESAGRLGPGRLIPIILALYLTPALLVVLLVGGMGLLILAVARAITRLMHGPEAWPRSPVGPESPAS